VPILTLVRITRCIRNTYVAVKQCLLTPLKMSTSTSVSVVCQEKEDKSDFFCLLESTTTSVMRNNHSKEMHTVMLSFNVT